MVTLGFSLRRHALIQANAVVRFAYPEVTAVVRGSAADSAGLHVGDEMLLIDRWNLVLEMDSLKTPDSLVATSMDFRRGQATHRRKVVPRALIRCRC